MSARPITIPRPTPSGWTAIVAAVAGLVVGVIAITNVFETKAVAKEVHERIEAKTDDAHKKVDKVDDAIEVLRKDMNQNHLQILERLPPRK